MKQLLIAKKIASISLIERTLDWNEYANIESKIVALNRMYSIQKEFESGCGIFECRWVRIINNKNIKMKDYPNIGDIYYCIPIGFDEDLYFHVGVYVNDSFVILYNNGVRIDYELVDITKIDLEKYEYIDVYLNEKIEENKKSISINITEDEKDIIRSYLLDGLNEDEAISMFYNNSCFIGNPKHGYYKYKG